MGMISIFCWNQASRCGQVLTPEALRSRLDELKAGPDVVWIDLSNPDAAEERLVFQEFLPIHTLSLEDVTRLRREPEAPPHFPKVEEFPDYLFVIVNPLADPFLDSIRRPMPLGRLPKGPVTQLSAIVTRHVLITHHYEPLSCIENLKGFLGRHEGQAERGPDFLFHLVLDALVDQYAPAVDHFDDVLDEIEPQVFEQPTQALYMRLLRMKREIILLRKTMIHEREVLARLARGEFALVDEREMVYYRNVYDHLVRFSDRIESSRDLVTDLMQTHLAATSNRLNSIMELLTMISTVVLPMTLVAGIYGMNFKHMPEIEWPWGYPFALALMAATGLAGYLFFRWTRWL
jgi:magnesium transporter